MCIENERKNSNVGQAYLYKPVFLFKNCYFKINEKTFEKDFKMINLTKSNFKTNINSDKITVSNKPSIFISAMFIMTIKQEIVELLKNGVYFDKSKINDKLLNFTFTPTKLNKLLILSTLTYLSEKLNESNEYTYIAYSKDFIEKFVENNTPIAGLTKIINQKCGFSIDYNFSFFGLNSYYNPDFHGDVCHSLFDYLNKDIDKSIVVSRLKNIIEYKNCSNEFKIKFALIDESFIDAMLITALNYILYPGYKMGDLLNKYKANTEWEKKLNTPVEIADVLVNYINNE